MPGYAHRMGMPVAAAALAVLGGCTSVIYDSNPEAPVAAQDEEPDFASRTVQNLLATSIRWVVERYPPPEGAGDGWFAINLPPGLTREQYIEVAMQVGETAAPVTPELEYLPTYHVGWVWMRGDDARVDVFRPVYSLSRPGEVLYQAITLHMSRRWASWRVDRTQPWEPGVVELPPLHYMPPEEPQPGTAVESEPVSPPQPAAGDGAAGTIAVE